MEIKPNKKTTQAAKNVFSHLGPTYNYSSMNFNSSESAKKISKHKANLAWTYMSGNIPS